MKEESTKYRLGHGRGDRRVGLPFASRSPVLARNGIAATSHPLVSQVAIDVLKNGGNAVDAAITANATIGLMEPTGNGIGGDLFATIWDPSSKQLHGLNSSGRSPREQTLEELKERLAGRQSLPTFGSLSVSVPGVVDGWSELHNRFGTLPWQQLFQPAIQYARDGFPVTQIISHVWAMNLEKYNVNKDDIEELDNFRKTYLINGTPPQHGQVFKNPDLANTLEIISLKGRDAYYQGEIADVIDAYMRRLGGPLRKTDMESHKSEWVEPQSVNYRGYDVYELPPNGQGIAALQMLNVLELYMLNSMGHNSADYLHIHAEAKKLAFADRAKFYADPDFYEVPLKGLLSKGYAFSRNKLVDMASASKAVTAGNPRLENGDTIYMTVADKNGMMVSLIQSNYNGMGSGLVADGLGFMFQNRGALFTLEEGHANVYAPGKRPFQTIIPGFIMKDGQPFLSFGLMGAHMQPQGHAQIVCNLIDFGMNIQEAGDAARYRHDGSSEPTGKSMIYSGVLSLESGVDLETINDLKQRGHNVEITTGDYGGYQAIMWDPVNGVYHGATEMRKDGEVVGY